MIGERCIVSDARESIIVARPSRRVYVGRAWLKPITGYGVAQNAFISGILSAAISAFRSARGRP